jgi:hypothetical protein
MRYLRVLMSGAATALWNGFRPVNAPNRVATSSG